jgi:heme/copper-type cytochrome/quinol oxidase subunit 2
MKKFIINAQAITLGVLGLLTLCIMGAEPSNGSEAALYRYQEACDNYGMFILWGWVVVMVIFVTLTILRFIISTNE